MARTSEIEGFRTTNLTNLGVDRLWINNIRVHHNHFIKTVSVAAPEDFPGYDPDSGDLYLQEDTKYRFIENIDLGGIQVYATTAYLDLQGYTFTAARLQPSATLIVENGTVAADINQTGGTVILVDAQIIGSTHEFSGYALISRNSTIISEGLQVVTYLSVVEFLGGRIAWTVETGGVQGAIRLSTSVEKAVFVGTAFVYPEGSYAIEQEQI